MSFNLGETPSGTETQIDTIQMDTLPEENAEEIVEQNEPEKLEEREQPQTEEVVGKEPEEEVIKEPQNDLVNNIPIANQSLTELENKEEKIQTSEYLQQSVSNEDLSLANELQSAFSTHLNTNMKIEMSDKNIRSTIPTGIDVLDTVLGGGVASGLVQIVGPPGAGKSALAAKIIAAGQRKYPGKFNAIYLDSEDATSTERLTQLGACYPPIIPQPGVTVEGVFRYIEGLCTFKEQNKKYMDIPWLVIWDSIANTLTESGMTAEDPNSVIGQRARALSHFLPRYVNKLNKYNISLVGINQLREKIDMGIFKTPSDLRYLTNKIIPGGQSLLFNSVQIIHITSMGDSKGEFGFLGAKIHAKAVKNKLFTPNIGIDMVFSFERGFSNFYSNFENLKKSKRIQAGAWCKLKSCPEAGSFRQLQALDLYRNNTKFRESFDNDVKDMIKTEYIDVYNSTDTASVDLIS